MKIWYYHDFFGQRFSRLSQFLLLSFNSLPSYSLLSFKSSLNLSLSLYFFFFLSSFGYLWDCHYMFWIILLLKLQGLYMPWTLYLWLAVATPLLSHGSTAILVSECKRNSSINLTKSHARLSKLGKGSVDRKTSSIVYWIQRDFCNN